MKRNPLLDVSGVVTVRARIMDELTSQKFLDTSIGHAENQAFLERFRYSIIASQLLNEDINHSQFDRRARSRSPENTEVTTNNESKSLVGAAVTSTAAFCFAWLIHWARGKPGHAFDYWKLSLLLVISTIAVGAASVYVRRQWLRMLRNEAIQAVSVFVENSEGFDIAASAAITFVQEVELVSRGYRMCV
jgi:hypothetical protein